MRARDLDLPGDLREDVLLRVEINREPGEVRRAYRRRTSRSGLRTVIRRR